MFTLKKLILNNLQPEWARPPSTPSSDGSTKPSTTQLPTTSPSTTTSAPVKNEISTKPVEQMSTSKPTETSSYAPNPIESDFESENEDTVQCHNNVEYLPHKDCNKVSHLINLF